MYLCIPSAAAAAAAAAALCVAILLLLLHQLLTAVHRVPYGKNCCWFIESDSIYCFLSLILEDTIYSSCMYVPLGSVVAFTASVFLHPRQ